MAKPKTRKPKASDYPRDSDVAFQLYEALKRVLRDLELIDSAIPAESSRTIVPGYRRNGKRAPEMSMESKCIIEGRKKDLLRYIQIISRDHLNWGKQLLAHGWTAEQHRQYRADANLQSKKITEIAGF